MLVGDYTLVVEDQAGMVLWTRVLTAATGHPISGDLFKVNGLVYRVRRVEHEVESDALSSRAWSYAHVFVAPI
jgi:hypothetical protein